jgi:ABC-2 type transport system ATP-binding protein
MIEMRGLTRKFDGLVAVDSLDLTVRKGAMFGFLGRNGAGKTTTLKMLSTVLRPSDGTASVGGHDIVEDAVEVRRIIGVIGEGVETTRPFWTPMEYLEFFLGLRGIPRKEARQVATHWLDRLGLLEHRKRSIGNFSSGMKKRLELCRALAHSPDVLLLDEPTKELDIPGKREMWDMLRGLVSDEGITVFLCSHEAAEIQALCQEIAIIRSGRLQYAGTMKSLPDPVLKITGVHPDRAVAALQGRVPLISESTVGNTLYLAAGDDTSLEEVQAALESAGLAFNELQEVHEFDERILAFL